MVIAALVSFAILLIAWIVAPSASSVAAPDTSQSDTDSRAAPVAAAL